MEAQALKRAAARFGLGMHLYELPGVWRPYNPDTKTFCTSPREAEPHPARSPRLTSSKRAQKQLDVIGRGRATTMHRELARLGLGRSEHQAFAQRTLKRPMESFADLTEHEARQVWRAAQRLTSRSSAA